MSFFDQFSKVTKDFGNKAQEMTKDIKGKLEEQQAIVRLNAQISEAKNQIKNTYTVIGERYYNQHKDDAENTCPNCGAAISKEALFCPNCGTKIERPQPEPQEEAEPEEKKADVAEEESTEELESIKMEAAESESGEKSVETEETAESEENSADK